MFHFSNINNKNLPEVSVQLPGTKPEGRLRLGMGISNSVGEEAAKLTNRRVLVVADPVLVSLGQHERILKSLRKSGICWDLFSQVEPEPHLSTLQLLKSQMSGIAYGAVIGLGGGSALDVAKLAAVMAVTNVEAADFFDKSREVTDSLPTILLPTTSGTGSEVSPYAVMSNGQKKVFIGSPYLYATVAMVDPLLTVTMPPKVTAATGLDALSHGIEGVMGKDNPYTRAMALQCAGLIYRYLPRAVEDGNDLEARYYMSFASVMGMLSYTQGGGLYAHSISYILTTGKGCAHGLGCGLALPYVIQLNSSKIAGLLEALDCVLHTKELEDCGSVADRIYQLVHRVGMPTGLQALGICEEELEAMADRLVKDYYRPLNPVELTPEKAKIFVRAMFDENLTFRV